jgi:2-(1,2-epoxy-1,2-dihydrophenyl)acetyl-CoA isomerase
MSDEVLLSELADGVLTLTLNRPDKRNAISNELWFRLRDTLRAVPDDADVRAVVLTGAGGAFCAGADLTDFVSELHPLERMRVVEDVVLGLHDLPVPTVAKVHGVAVGAGWNLALCCDFVVATPESRFSQIFAKRGLSVDSGGSWLLPRLVGMQQAKRLTYLADMIDTAEAESLGLVTWTEPAEHIDAFVAELAARLAAGPPIALAQTKRLLHESGGRSMAEALVSESRAQTVNLATEDTAAAWEAFRAKTEPTFTGHWRK